ncbi:MAG: hypothetical protein JWM18_4120 [Chloroflexi bacterium]|nr:hypothetical protein [Chloroflexota bacterium]
MSAGERRLGDILDERAPALALAARQLLYEEQPELSKLGENGRERTLEDFVHHFRALASMDTTIFAAHVRYCEALFALRQFPQHWLTDAWRFMETTMARDMPSHAGEVTSVLRAGVAAARAG